MTSKDDAKTAIYTRLASVSAFHPSSADLFHDFTLQSGDIVSVKSGEDTYSVPVYGMHMKWNGKSTVTIGNSGARKRPTLEKMAQRSSRSVGGAYRAEKKRQTRLEWIVGIDDDGEYFVDHPGKIALAINEQTGETNVNINADKIKIGDDGTNEILLSDVLGLYSGMLWAKGDMYVTSAPGDTGHGKLYATEIHIGVSGNRSLTFDAGHGESAVSISRDQANMLINNSQTHVKVYGPSSSGVYTIYYLPATQTSYASNPTPSSHNGWLSAGTITVPRESS